MRVKVRSGALRFHLPVPLSLARHLIKFVPETAFIEARKDVPEPYNQLINKGTLTMLVTDCLDILSDYKGLEIVHVEAQDGTFVSIVL